MIAVPVNRVFKRGEVIATTIIDGKQSDAQIFRELLVLVDTKGARVVQERGVAPVLTTEEPLLYASDTSERIFEALRRIQAIGDPAMVRLVAAEDISTIDHPRVRLEVAEATLAERSKVSQATHDGVSH